MFRDVKKERTGWRDKDLSERHRLWGWNCPAVDLDFLFLEYDKGKAAAIVEYKHESAQPQDARHPTYQALIDLGNRAELPVFAVRYSSDYTKWLVVPLNVCARKYLQERKTMGENEWVSLLYSIRGYSIPPKILNELEILKV